VRKLCLRSNRCVIGGSAKSACMAGRAGGIGSDLAVGSTDADRTATVHRARSSSSPARVHHPRPVTREKRNKASRSVPLQGPDPGSLPATACGCERVDPFVPCHLDREPAVTAFSRVSKKMKSNKLVFRLPKTIRRKKTPLQLFKNFNSQNKFSYF
jgi:hypothetical protein